MKKKSIHRIFSQTSVASVEILVISLWAIIARKSRTLHPFWTIFSKWFCIEQAKSFFTLKTIYISRFGNIFCLRMYSLQPHHISETNVNNDGKTSINTSLIHSWNFITHNELSLLPLCWHVFPNNSRWALFTTNNCDAFFVSKPYDFETKKNLFVTHFKWGEKK